MEIQFELENIEAASRQAWQAGNLHKVWAFKGEMGAGKTTFIHALCNVLKVTSTVASPTYSIINEYKSDVLETVYHMDWYRLSGEEEALQAGVEDVLYSGRLCLVEWPARAKDLLPADTLYLQIEILPGGSRKLTLHEPLRG